MPQQDYFAVFSSGRRLGPDASLLQSLVRQESIDDATIAPVREYLYMLLPANNSAKQRSKMIATFVEITGGRTHIQAGMAR
jgi:hypothetical protein